MAVKFSKMGILYLICLIRAILRGNKHWLGWLIGKAHYSRKGIPYYIEITHDTRRGKYVVRDKRFSVWDKW